LFRGIHLLLTLTGVQTPLGIGVINTLAVSLAKSNSYSIKSQWTFLPIIEKMGNYSVLIMGFSNRYFDQQQYGDTNRQITLGTVLSPYLFLKAAKILGALLSTSWNFLAYRHWVFADQNPV
jgi:putative flippase GtrA